MDDLNIDNWVQPWNMTNCPLVTLSKSNQTSVRHLKYWIRALVPLDSESNGQDAFFGGDETKDQCTIVWSTLEVKNVQKCLFLAAQVCLSELIPLKIPFRALLIIPFLRLLRKIKKVFWGPNIAQKSVFLALKNNLGSLCLICLSFFSQDKVSERTRDFLC